MRLPLASQADVLPEYWQLIRTLKLLADDVFIETLGPPAQRSQRIVQGRDARSAYTESLKRVIEASPFLFKKPQDRGLPLYPLARSGWGLHFLSSRRAMEIEAGGRYLIDLAAARAQTALRTHLAKPTIEPLDDETLHLFGVTFLLQQMFLVDMSLYARPSDDGANWYRAVALEVKRMRNDVLGRLAQLEREAALRNASLEAVQLGQLSDQLVDELSRVYSVRFEETVDLWAHRSRELKQDNVHGFARTIVGTNQVTEIVRSYRGRNTPDRLRGGDELAVAEVLGMTIPNVVAVYGRLAGRGSRLGDVDSPQKQLILRPAQTKLRDGSLVVASGTLDRSGTTLNVSESSPMIGSYKSSAGFRMPVGKRPTELDLRPDYRRSTEALVLESSVEQRIERFAGAIAGQERLLSDLVYFPSVRAQFQRRMRQRKPIDLHDIAFRGAVWNALYREFHKTNPDGALTKFLEYLKRYLDHFTRHTLWNVRDSGRDYFRTTWPLSVSNQAVHDCGVYCVLAAYDIYRAVQGVSGAPHIELGFITYLNHIALFGYAGKLSFFINNDKILTEVPKSMPSGRAERANYALRRWAQFGFADTYRLTYSIAIVRAPHWTISTRLSEAGFKRVMWARYQRYALWWGLQPGIAQEHHKQIAKYDRLMHELDLLVRNQSAYLSDPGSTPMQRASTLATEMFKIAFDLVDKRRYREDRPVPRLRQEFGVAVVSPPGKEPPLYLVVRALLDARRKGKALAHVPQTQAQQKLLLTKPPTREKHAAELANRAF